MVQWLGLCPVIAEGLGSIPGQGTKIPQAVQQGQKKKKKKKRERDQETKVERHSELRDIQGKRPREGGLTAVFHRLHHLGSTKPALFSSGF